MIAADQPVESTSLQNCLDTLRECAAAEGVVGVESRLTSLREKLAEGRLHLAVLGQMKRGKSSLINALLKADVLPTGVLPVTAIITEIRYGEAPTATIVYSAGGLREQVPISTLADYISETKNPGNKKQVASVEITYPSPFLKDGIVLIDTPGIGSTHAHNTEITEGYLNNIDAGIVVLSVDPPITAVESRFVSELQDEIPKLFFIVNKIDIVTPAELAEILQFVENELSRHGITAPEMFPISARQDRNMEQSANGAPPSGLSKFEQRLHTFLLNEKRQVLVRSVAGDALEIARSLRFAAAIRIRAATMTANELKEKKQALDQLLDRTDNDMRELQVLLRQRSADVLALVERDLSEHVEACVPDVRNHLGAFRKEHPNASGRAFGALLEDWLMRDVEAVFRKWKIQEDQKVQVQLDDISSHFVEMANGILGRLEQAASLLFDIPVQHLKITCLLRAESHLYYKVERVFYSLDSFLLLLPPLLMRPIVMRRMIKNVPELLDMNAGRVRFDYLERLQASLKRFETDIRAAVDAVSISLRSALTPTEMSAGQTMEKASALDAVIEKCSYLLRQ